MLYSASNDHMVICWNIGNKKGTAYELRGKFIFNTFLKLFKFLTLINLLLSNFITGHNGKISSVVLAKGPQLLLSGGEDHMIIGWSMKVKREETPEWRESDVCERCQSPFFWNFRSMVDQKKIGQRQHHCRYCGNFLSSGFILKKLLN